MEIPSLPKPDNFPLVRLSQGQLNLLEACPPQFQRIFLEQLNTPSSPQQQEKQTWGSQFHLLMQQRELGLPIEELLTDEDQFHHSLTALLKAAPEIGQIDLETWREAEHCRTLAEEGYLLTAIYDLVIATPTQAKIYDWKTFLQPEKPTKLAKNWQTRLYLYILAETTTYPPEQLAMTYWFVKLPTQPQSITFTYNRRQHEQTRRDLTRILTQLDTWLINYSEGEPFPHRSDCQQKCPYASFWNTQLASEEENKVLSIDEIAEINPFG